MIHAGIYDPKDSLKTLTCVEGRKLLYARCERDGIAHNKCGKLIVATTEDEVAVLHKLRAQALQNDAGDVALLSTSEVAHMEPRVRAIAALFSPETGIVDAHSLLTSYRVQAKAHGCEFVLRTEVTGIERVSGALRVTTCNSSDELATIEVAHVINAAGLLSDRVAAMAGLDINALGYRLHYCKGDYFRLASRLRGLCQHLVYPVPAAGGLGTHLTMDLDGTLNAGPDAEYVSVPRYDLDAGKAALFGTMLRRFVPEVKDEDLSPNYAGVRPKLQGPGEAFVDFVMDGPAKHGIDGLVNLIGIESPGLTASEAIAQRVAELIL